MMGLNEVKFNLDLPTTSPTIEDVVGTGREFLKEVIVNIKNKFLFEHVGLLPNKSYLLEGLPGTGKTYSAKALNNTLNKEYFEKLELWKYDASRLKADNRNIDDLEKPLPNVVFFSYDIGRYGTAYINEGSRTIQKFFDTAYMYSLRSPTVLVFDEADSVMGSRKGGWNHKEDNKLLETIMKNMQSLHDTKNMYLLLMTNFRDGLDEAVLRAGRIDKKYHFDLPNEKERRELFQIAIDRLNKKAGYQVIRRYNVNTLAEMTEGYNGADVVNVVEQTVKERVSNLVKYRKDKIVPAIYVTSSKLEKTILDYNKKFKEKKYKLGF